MRGKFCVNLLSTDRYRPNLIGSRWSLASAARRGAVRRNGWANGGGGQQQHMRQIEWLLKSAAAGEHVGTVGPALAAAEGALQQLRLELLQAVAHPQLERAQPPRRILELCVRTRQAVARARGGTVIWLG